MGISSLSIEKFLQSKKVELEIQLNLCKAYEQGLGLRPSQLDASGRVGLKEKFLNFSYDTLAINLKKSDLAKDFSSVFHTKNLKSENWVA